MQNLNSFDQLSFIRSKSVLRAVWRPWQRQRPECQQFDRLFQQFAPLIHWFPRAIRQSHACMTLANAARVTYQSVQRTPFALHRIMLDAPYACIWAVDFLILSCDAASFAVVIFTRVILQSYFFIPVQRIRAIGSLFNTTIFLSRYFDFLPLAALKREAKTTI